MSKYYGTVEGQAQTLGTRRGSSKSGIKSSVQSYNGSVIMELRDVNGQDILFIDTADRSTNQLGDRQFRGTITEFNEAMQLLKDIRDKKVSVTRHRTKSNTQLAVERIFG